MGSQMWIIFSAIIIIGILLILALFLNKGKKTKPDYYTIFVMGIIWALAGIPMKNYALSIMGIIFVIIGWIKKDKWQENRQSWDKLDKKQRIWKAIMIGVLSFLVIAGIIVLLFTKQNI